MKITEIKVLKLEEKLKLEKWKETQPAWLRYLWDLKPKTDK